MSQKNDKKKHRKLPKKWEQKYWEHLGEYADEIDEEWREILDCAEDDDLRAYALYYRYSKSLESMSEELAYMSSRFKHMKKDFDENFIDKNDNYDFSVWIKDKNLKKAAEQLTGKQKKVIELKFLHGYKEHEIAEIMGIKSQSAISDILRRALEKIMVELLK